MIDFFFLHFYPGEIDFFEKFLFPIRFFFDFLIKTEKESKN